MLEPQHPGHSPTTAPNTSHQLPPITADVQRWGTPSAADSDWCYSRTLPGMVTRRPTLPPYSSNPARLGRPWPGTLGKAMARPFTYWFRPPPTLTPSLPPAARGDRGTSSSLVGGASDPSH